MKIDNNYSTKDVNRNTQKQEFKKKNFADFWLGAISPAKKKYERLVF